MLTRGPRIATRLAGLIGHLSLPDDQQAVYPSVRYLAFRPCSSAWNIGGTMHTDVGVKLRGLEFLDHQFRGGGSGCRDPNSRI